VPEVFIRIARARRRSRARAGEARLLVHAVHSGRVASDPRRRSKTLEPGVEKRLEYALKHKAILKRFGRCLHRSAAFGRASTPEEELYLAEPAAGF
jgi:uncharacterized protein (DUF924 family)